MSTVSLEGITVLADDVDRLAVFFERAIGLTVAVREEHYVEFVGDGIRLAIFRRHLMGPNTLDHASFRAARGSQTFELNFECPTPADVELSYTRFVDHGATPIAPPTEMSWGHFTAFFADPEGNIHSLFAVLATERSQETPL